MGRIFTWDEVSSRKVPYEDSIEDVADLLRQRLSNEKGVVFATLCGSVARNDFNIRSDVDCVIVYNNEHEAQVRKTTNALSVFARELHVPVNFIPCDVQIAGTRFHHLGPSFVGHLNAAIQAGGLIKGEDDFLDDLGYGIEVKEEIESYLRIKLYGMMESLAVEASFSEEQQARFFKKGLEAAMHSARKVLDYDGLLEGDSKREVQTRYREVVPSGLSGMLDAILDIDHVYTEELYSQLDDGPEEDRYRAILALVSMSMPRVAQFIRLNIMHICAQTRR